MKEDFKEEQFRVTIAIGIIALILALFAITTQLEIKDIQLNVLEIIGYFLVGYIALVTIAWTPRDNFFGKHIPREQLTKSSHYFYVFGIIFALSFVIGNILQNFFKTPIDPFLVVPFLLFILIVPFRMIKTRSKGKWEIVSKETLEKYAGFLIPPLLGILILEIMLIVVAITKQEWLMRIDFVVGIATGIISATCFFAMERAATKFIDPPTESAAVVIKKDKKTSKRNVNKSKK